LFALAQTLLSARGLFTFSSSLTHFLFRSCIINSGESLGGVLPLIVAYWLSFPFTFFLRLTIFPSGWLILQGPPGTYERAEPIMVDNIDVVAKQQQNEAVWNRRKYTKRLFAQGLNSYVSAWAGAGRADDSVRDSFIKQLENQIILLKNPGDNAAVADKRIPTINPQFKNNPEYIVRSLVLIAVIVRPHPMNVVR
jgi:hypothetical protein